MIIIIPSQPPALTYRALVRVEIVRKTSHVSWRGRTKVIAVQEGGQRRPASALRK